LKRLLSNRWVLIGAGLVLAAAIALALTLPGDAPRKLSVDQFTRKVEAGEVNTAKFLNRDDVIEGELKGGERYRVTFTTDYADDLTELTVANGVKTTADNQAESGLESFLYDFLPTLLIIGVFLWFVLQMQGGGRNRFGRARARKAKNLGEVTFADVAGADEAVEELQEIKEFLSDPSRFEQLGARIPRGVLLFGPPGTGKTLLARAVAGEAGVPFLSISGSDFVELFVGVGAARVRDLFRQAKEDAPAIVFVDEIDAVGRHRGAGVGGGHDEREQTLNQLLVEMDGFDANSGVILMAATNRPDVLDPALLRPGRFDRHIVIDTPDLAGRRAILEVHARNKRLDPSVDLAVLARRTPGFTGADLANVINEGALLAGRRGADSITAADLSEAIDRVVAGPERRSRVMSEKDKAVTAYHEAGHALVGHLLPHADPVHKVSIVARGRSLGWTQLLPTEDRYTRSRAELLDDLAVFMGGLSAEELVFDERTTGAADDIERATSVARAMVTEYGMSDELGPRKFGHRSDEPFLGKEHMHQADYGDVVAAKVDEEIQRLIDDAHGRAGELLRLHRNTLDHLAAELIARETLDDDDLAAIFALIDEPAGEARR